MAKAGSTLGKQPIPVLGSQGAAVFGFCAGFKGEFLPANPDVVVKAELVLPLFQEGKVSRRGLRINERYPPNAKVCFP